MTRVDDHLWTAPDAPDWSRFKGELEGLLQSGIAMFASPHAFALYHRERLAVLLSSALFLAAALPLFWAIV